MIAKIDLRKILWAFFRPPLSVCLAPDSMRMLNQVSLLAAGHKNNPVMLENLISEVLNLAWAISRKLKEFSHNTSQCLTAVRGQILFWTRVMLAKHN